MAGLPWSMVCGAVLRVLQAGIEAAPTLLCGLMVAGILRRMLGPAATRRLFGGRGWRGLVRAWVVGMLLPVCSLGVIPIVRELRRAGVGTGALLAFALTAPMFNPISFLYGLTLSDPIVVICFTLASLAIVTLTGLAWDRWFATAEPLPAEDEPLPPPGLKRLAAVAVAASREWTGPTLAYVGVALAGVAVLSALLPMGSLESTMRHDDPTSPLLMAAVALPAYDSPMKAMMQLGLMFEHGNSVGAALVLLVLGAGANLGTLVWSARTYTILHTGAWLALVLVTVLGIAFAIEKPLYFAAHEDSHTHAFDDFAAPFPADADAYAASVVWPKLESGLQEHEIVGVFGLAALLVVGVGVRAIAPWWSLERFLARPSARAAGRPQPFYNRPIPGRVLVAIGCAGLLAFSVIGCYVYYPDPDFVLSQMFMVRGDALAAVLSGDVEQAIRQIRRLDDLSRKLEVSVFLRSGRVDRDARLAAEELRELLEELRDTLRAGRTDEARGMVAAVLAAYARCRQAYGRADPGS